MERYDFCFYLLLDDHVLFRERLSRLLASEPDAVGSDGSLRPDTAVWLSA